MRREERCGKVGKFYERKESQEIRTSRSKKSDECNAGSGDAFYYGGNLYSG